MVMEERYSIKGITLGITWTKTAYHEYEILVPDNWDTMSEKEQEKFLAKYHDDPPHDCYGEGVVTSWDDDL